MQQQQHQEEEEEKAEGFLQMDNMWKCKGKKKERNSMKEGIQSPSAKVTYTLPWNRRLSESVWERERKRERGERTRERERERENEKERVRKG